MRRYRFKVHSEGPTLWPSHKPLEEVLELQATTPPPIFEATYQGRPTAPGGQTFKRAWWRSNRYDATNQEIITRCIARWVAWDTAMKDKETAAFSVGIVGELTPDYRLLIREVWRARLEFPELPESIRSLARRYRLDGKLRGVIIEDKASGTSAIQTLQASTEDWVSSLIIPFSPSGSKEERAEQASTWCANGSVLLPHPSPAVPWLIDFEDELFNFPQSEFKDQVDTFSEIIIYLEHLLAAGLRARMGHGAA